MPKIIRSFYAIAVTSLALAGPAFAHAHLKGAMPAVDGTVTASPSEIDLTFSEGVNLKFTGIEVTGPDKKAVALGDAMLMNDDKTIFMAPVSGTLAPGVYTVAWHALSTDGHKTKGTYTFTVKP